MNRPRPAALLVSLIFLGLVAAPVNAQALTGVQGSSCAESIQGIGPTLHPEGVAYDPRRNRFLVGSVTHGTVSVVNPDGTVRTLVSDPALITTMGLLVDHRRGRLLVANGDIGIADRTSPQTKNKTAGLGIYDLRTGARIKYVNLGVIDAAHGHFANDIAMTPDGTAYVTDSLSGAIYRVPVTGEVTTLVRDDRLAPVGSGNGANGIVWHPGGFLLVAQSSGRGLYRVPLDHPDLLAPVTVDKPIGAPDGLLLTSAHSLYAIDNTIANRVVSIGSTDGWRTATVRESQSWPDPAPTTMARGRCGIYVLTGRLDLVLSGKPSDEFRLHRFTPAGEY